MSLSISIIIPSLGSEANLLRLIESIRIQDIEPAALEVVIVLNGVAELKVIEIKKNIGPSAFKMTISRLAAKGVNLARNQGIVLAKNEVLLFLDDDCTLLTRSFLKTHLQIHEQRPSVFALGGGYVPSEEAGYFDKIYNYLQMRWLTLGSLAGPAHFLLGGNFSVKTSLLTQNSLRFDDQIAYGGSEYEFFVKAIQLGLILEADMPAVQHNTNETLKSLTRKHFLQGRGAALIDQRYPARIFVGGKSITDPLQSFSSNILFLYFNYVFWAGYYKQEKKLHVLPIRLMGDVYRSLNYYRYEILKRISREISERNRNS